VQVEKEVGELPMVLVQNKVDLIDKAVSSNVEVEELAKKLKLKLYRTCVSENLNVDKVPQPSRLISSRLITRLRRLYTSRAPPYALRASYMAQYSGLIPKP
jgi:ribosome biogenesis GTPase A